MEARFDLHVASPGVFGLRESLALASSHDYVAEEVIFAVDGGAEQIDKVIEELRGQGFASVEVVKEILTAEQTNSQSVVQAHLGHGAEVTAALPALYAFDDILWGAPNVVYSGPDVREFIPNDPQYGQQWHHNVMENAAAWDITFGDSSIVVGITDDGIDIDHPDLNDAIWTNPAEIPGNSIDDDGNGYVDDVNGYNFRDGNNDVNADPGDAHGTHVSGIVGAELNNGVGVAGTAGGVTLLPLKWYDGSGWTSSVVAETFTYAADNGAHIVNSSYNMDVWAGNPVVTAAFQYMYDAGVLHFNSAGNGNDFNPPRQVFEQTLFVANTNTTDTKSGSSNYGDGIDIAAPGSSIRSTLIGSYGNNSGTSMAAPNAAGVAALIWSANPTWTRDQVVAQLLGTADNIDGANPAYVGLLGAGRVNSNRALTETIRPPEVASIEGLPSDGVAAAANTITGFTVRFDQYMDPASVTSAASYDLRQAGADNLFDTSDDIVRTVTPDSTYMVGTNEFEISIDGQALGNGEYRLRLVSGGLQNPFSTSLDGDADGVAGGDHDVFFSVDYQPTVRTELLGSAVSVSPSNGDILASAGTTNQHTVAGTPGETITAIVRPDSNVTVTVEFDSTGQARTAAQPGDAVVVPSLVVPASGQATLMVSADGATGYEFDFYRNANVDALVDLATPVALAGQEVDSGSYRTSALGEASGDVGTSDVDEFEVQLVAGSNVDIVLKGDGTSFANAVLRITDSSGSVLAEAVGGESSNYDLGILDFVVPSAGTYIVRIDAEMAGQYELLIAEGLVFETDPPAFLMYPARSLGGVAGGIGYLDDTGFSYTRVNHPDAFVDISTTGTALGLGDDSVAEVTTTVGNVLLPAGTISISNNGGVLAGSGTLPRSNLPLPNFSFDEGLLVFWDDLEATSGDVYWEELQIDGVDALVVQWNDRPHFAVGDTLTFQLQLFAAGPVLARYVYADATTGNAATDGAKSATIGLQQSRSEAYGFSYNAQSIADGDVIDFLAGDVDRYALQLDAGEAIQLSSQTPLDQSASNLVNQVDPAIQIRDIAGEVVASDTDSLDGKNAIVTFVPEVAGMYFAEIFSEDQVGEYELISRLVPTGDFDFDGDFDGVDINLLTAAIASGQHLGDFDLTGDRLVDLSDRDEWLAIAGAANLPSGNAYLIGDANLDGFVDGRDFDSWNSNKFTAVAAWTAGDFTANGQVDGSDFVLWNNNKFMATVEANVRPTIIETIFADEEDAPAFPWL